MAEVNERNNNLQKRQERKSASRVLEAVANRILSHCDVTFIQESAAVN